MANLIKRVTTDVIRRRKVAALRRRRLAYAPDLDGQADPGEIVWTWVAYEDDPRQGKDRPVLVVGRESRTRGGGGAPRSGAGGALLFGLMLSSQDDRDGQRHWFPLGAWEDGTSVGPRAASARPSWVRLDRVLTMREDSIRREGAVLDQTRFDRVGEVLRARYGWH